MANKILLPLAFIYVYSFGQSALESNKQALKDFSAIYPMEKIYVHTDKPIYAVGDTIWLKAYVVDAVLHQPDSASGVIYMDLIDAEKKVAVHKIFKTMSGAASGRVVIPESIGSGKYQLRAYTNWMRNFPEELYFQKALEILSIGDNAEDEPENKKTEFDRAYFFPEGGNLVQGLQSRVAFKAVDRNGKGIDVVGTIVSGNGETVAAVKSQHLGMGYFTFKPSSNTEYFFVSAAAPSNRIKLPAALSQGYSMMVDNLNKTSIKIYVSHNLPSPDRCILIAHQRSQILYAAQTGSDKNAVGFVIPKDALKDDGVIHLTLFDSKGQPQCERLIYRNTKTAPTPKVSISEFNHQKREKITLEFFITDYDGEPIVGDFSLAVTDAQQVNKDPLSENIRSFFLLSSDVREEITSNVKGEIEQPSYYFDENETNAEVHLDLLLMTQGWRRFKWTDVLKGNNKPPVNRIERGITVSGQVMQPNGKPSKKPVDLTLLLPGEVITKKADNDGRFEVVDLDFSDSTHIVVQGSKANGGKSVIVKFDPANIPVATYFSTEHNRINDDLYLKKREEQAKIEKALQLQKIQMLKAVEVVATRIEKDPRRSLYSSNVRTIKVDDKLCATATSFTQLVQSRVPSLEIRGTLPDIKITLRGRPVGYLVDGLPYTDVNYVATISPCDIEAIDISTVPSPLVPAGATGGLISILTRRGNPNYDWTQEVAKGVSVGVVSGFDYARDFFSPDYQNTSDKLEIPDLRSTIFWSPQIRTDKEGRASVTFYTNDLMGEINVNLEGLSNTGKPIALNKRY